MKAVVGFGCLVFLAGFVQADYATKYEVTVTNITKGQSFTPQLLATHDRHVAVFELGQPASLAVEVLAEGGDTSLLTDALVSMSYRVGDVQTIGGLLGPGQSVTTTIEGWVNH